MNIFKTPTRYLNEGLLYVHVCIYAYGVLDTSSYIFEYWELPVDVYLLSHRLLHTNEDWTVRDWDHAQLPIVCINLKNTTHKYTVSITHTY